MDGMALDFYYDLLIDENRRGKAEGLKENELSLYNNSTFAEQ
jgi:hypothetical protein